MKRILFLFFLTTCISFLCLAQNDKEISIGKQKWHKDLLSTPVFANGESIPFAKTESEWRIAGEKKKPCYTYLKDKNGEVVTPKIYIYNWYVINDPRGIAPKGYRIPSNSDLMELISFCGGVCEASQKLKSSYGWDANDLIEDGKKTENGTDEFGMSLSPIPLILPGGQQNDFYLSSGFWTSTDAKNGAEIRSFFSDDLDNHYLGHVAYCFNITFHDCMNYFNLFFKEGGLPIRCIKDNPERNSPNYPIPVLSNTADNLTLEKDKHIKTLCRSCNLNRSESSTSNSVQLLKEVYRSNENKNDIIFYFDQSNYINKPSSAGIGARLSIENGECKIDEIVKGGACDLSENISEQDVLLGMYENDKLFEFKNLELEQIIKKIRGPENTTIKLLIKSSSGNKKFDVELVRGKIPNWDLKTLIDRSHYQSAFPLIIDNYYFYYKYKLLPEKFKYPEKTRFVYILSKAARLYYCGPENYSLDDYFHYPKTEWDKDDIISGAYQLAALFRGGTEFNPIILKSIDNAKNLMMTFHFKVISSEKPETSKNISKLTFEHTEDQSQITMFFRFN